LARPFLPELLHDEWLALIAAAIDEIRRVEEPLINDRMTPGTKLGSVARSWDRACAR
jgi:hypothetical protein